MDHLSTGQAVELDTVKNHCKKSKIRRYATCVLCLLLLTNSCLSYAAGSPANLDIRVAEYLIKAERALEMNRLTTPADDSAIVYIEQALAIAPKHPRAMHLLQQVTKRYGELVTATLRHGAKIRQRSLNQAQTFRERANAVINKHHVTSAELSSIDHTIATYTESNDEGTVTDTNKDSQETALEVLLDRHINLTELALDRGKYNDAQWHIGQADALLIRYDLTNPRLQVLKQEANSLAQASQYRDFMNESRSRQQKDIDLARKLVLDHLELGERVLRKGNIFVAQRHRRLAEDLALQYGINEPKLEFFALRIAERSAWGNLPSRIRVFGTF